MTDEIGSEYSDEVLEETPGKIARILAGMGAVPAIRQIMAVKGMMTDDDVAEGRDLLITCVTVPRAIAASDSTESQSQRAALAEIDEWDEPHFTQFRATLHRAYPSAEEYVFSGGLKASQGASSVAGVATFLGRVDALESGSDDARSGTAKDDKAAVKLLAQRGLTKEERKRLAKLVETALSGGGAPEGAPESPERRRALVAARQWYDEWAAVAHARIKKRAYLIRLGLASRKRKKKPEDPTTK